MLLKCIAEWFENTALWPLFQLTLVYPSTSCIFIRVLRNTNFRGLELIYCAFVLRKNSVIFSFGKIEESEFSLVGE